jgi:hypothetical protein
MILLRAWRRLTWKHWAWATAIPVLVSASMPLQDFDTNRYWALWRVLYHTPWYLFFSYVFLFAIAIAEASAPDPAAPSAWRYVAALLAASAICIATLGAFPELVQTAPKHVVAGQLLVAKSKETPEVRAKARRLAGMLGLGALALIHAWLATFIYVRLRNSRRARRSLADAELERSEAQRSLLSAQLVAAQAQVDPAFVLQAIENVERAYQVDPARADVLLDEFIAFLRDAIPRLRGDEPAARAEEPAASAA